MVDKKAICEKQGACKRYVGDAEKSVFAIEKYQGCDIFFLNCTTAIGH